MYIPNRIHLTLLKFGGTKVIAGVKRKTQGFTMVEVLIGILLTGMFITAALELMLIGLAWQTSNQRRSQALMWLREDEKKILEIADSLAYTDEGKCKDLYNSYAVNLWKKLENETLITPKKLPGRSDPQIILNDTGSNYSGSIFTFEKNLLPGQKKYNLKRRYLIASSEPEVLNITYEITDNLNKKILENQLYLKTKAYYKCSF